MAPAGKENGYFCLYHIHTSNVRIKGLVPLRLQTFLELRKTENIAVIWITFLFSSYQN